MDSLKEHAASAASGIMDGLAIAWIDDVHHGPHDRTRHVELARLFVGGVSQAFDEVFVSLPEDVCLGGTVPRRQRGKVLDGVA